MKFSLKKGLILFIFVFSLISGCTQPCPEQKAITVSPVSVQATGMINSDYQVTYEIKNIGTTVEKDIRVIFTMKPHSSFEGLTNQTMNINQLNPSETKMVIVNFSSKILYQKLENFNGIAYQQPAFCITPS